MHKIFYLSNGIRVVTENIDYVKSISIGVWVGSGSAMEKLKNNGVSHFIEHLLFKGTTTKDAKEIAESMDRLGGQLNAVTSKEYTCYYARILSEHINAAIELLSDMIRNSTFLEENIDIERKVILEEINMCEDTPEDYIHDILSRTLWGESSLGYPIAGTADILNNIDKNAILSYFDDNYTAENIVISLTGNFDEEDALKNLEERFGGIKKKSSSFQKQPKVKLSQNAEVVKRDIEQCQLCLGFGGFSRSDDRKYALTVANAVFGGNMSSRLFQKIREEKGLSYSVYSYTNSYESNGALVIYAGLSAENLYPVLDIINEEIRLLKKEGLSDSEIEMAKNQLKASIIMGGEGMSARMSSYGKGMLFENKIKTDDELIKIIDSVDKCRIKDAIDDVFKLEHLNIAVLGNVQESGDKIISAMDF